MTSNPSGFARVTYNSGKQWSAAVVVDNLNSAIGYSGSSGVQTAPYLYQKRLISTPRTFDVDLHYDF